MVGEALHQTDHVVGVPAEGGCAGQQRDTAFEAGQRVREPLGRWLAIDDGAGFRQQRTAEFGLFVAQHHPHTGAGGGQCGGDAGGAGADHQDLAMGVLVDVAVWIGLLWGFPQAGGGADRGFVEPGPERRRPQEGLVIEPRRQQRAEPSGGGAEVEAQRWKAVLAGGGQSLVQFDLSGTQVGCDPTAPAIDGDQGIRFLRSRRQDASGAVVFERAADQVDAIRQQGRGQCVARVSRVGAAVEAETDVPTAGDAAPGCEAEGLGHGLAVPEIRSVTVSRVALKKRPQPNWCRHLSLCRPLGLDRM